jgi:hypothetical protein
MSYLAFEKKEVVLKCINPEVEFNNMCQGLKCKTSGLSSQEQRTEIHFSSVKHIHKNIKKSGVMHQMGYVDAYTLDPYLWSQRGEI